MSDRPGAPPTEVQKARFEAAAWIQRQSFWDWNDSLQAEFEAWLNASPSHRIAFLRSQTAWQRTERLVALRRPPSHRIENTARRKWIPFAGLAAAVAIAGVIGGSLFPTASTSREFSTGIGEHRVIQLSDGSQIELNTNTALRLASAQRKAWLEKGEAYFQIVHDPKNPFSVTVAGKRVEDLGTKFVVRANGQRITVGLLEGKAIVRDLGTARVASLSPGDVATADGDRLSVSSPPHQALMDDLAWRQGMLVFDNASLADVVRELNRYNRQKVVIADPELARLKLDASIPTNGIDAFVRVARNFLGLHAHERDNEIVISH